jgi:large subunit ribosomal protein L18
MNKKEEKRIRLKKKIRSKVFGTKECPRFSVFRSNKFIYGQLIDDEARATLCAFSDMDIKDGNKTERASSVGKKVAELAKVKGISKIVFDRNGFKYTGRVKALADGAREGGLIF